MKLLKVMSFVIALCMATAIAPKASAQSANSGTSHTYPAKHASQAANACAATTEEPQQGQGCGSRSRSRSRYGKRWERRRRRSRSWRYRKPPGPSPRPPNSSRHPAGIAGNVQVPQCVTKTNTLARAGVQFIEQTALSRHPVALLCPNERCRRDPKQPSLIVFGVHNAQNSV